MESHYNLLIYRLGSMGDTVVALPAFHAIARLFPDFRRLVLTNFPISAKAAPLEGVLGGSGLIDGAIPYPMHTRDPRVLLDLMRRIRALKVDTMVYLTPARGLMACYRDLLFFRLCGIRRIIGAPVTRDQQNNRIGPDGLMERECARLARNLVALGPIDLKDPANWDLRLNDAERAAGRAVCAPFGEKSFIAINMGGKDSSKDWGIDNWVALLAGVDRAFPGLGLLVVGAPVDAGRVGIVARSWSGAVVNACGKLSPRESGAAMAGACLFVGHDSGPLHLAAAVGVPCIGLFGSLNQPCKWHPPGTQHRIIHHVDGVQTISVEEVLSAVLGKLHAAASPE